MFAKSSGEKKDIMKQAITFVLGLLLFISQAGAQQFNQDTVTTPPQPQAQQGWVQVPIDTNLYIVVGFNSPDTCYAVNAASYYRSIDGGSNWQRISWAPPLSSGIGFMNAQTGFIIGSGQICYHTGDGGQTWTQADDSDQHAYFVCPVTLDTAFLSGSNYVSRTTNAGKSWSSQELNTNGINAIGFADSKNGIVVGGVEPGPLPGHPQLTAGCWKTTDGGETWVQQYVGCFEDLGGVAFVNLDTIIAIGSGFVMRSTNSGVKWDSIRVQGSLGSIACKGNRLIAVGPRGEIFTSTDAGLTWQQESSGVTSDLYSIAMADSSTALVSGVMGVILKTINGGVSWVQFSPPSTTSLQTSTFPEPSSGQLQFSYSLPQLQDVTLLVFDLTGRIVATVLNKQLQTVGNHIVAFDGSSFPTGTYTYQILTERYNATGKFTIVK
jgi:photosystem II stability/assembly factor-like uncharacterized protein